MKILFNLGVFGKHGVEHALINLIQEFKSTAVEIAIHEIYEPEQKSPLFAEISEYVIHKCSLPRSTFWGFIHMSRRKNVVSKIIDALGIFHIHKVVAETINGMQLDLVIDYDLSLLRSAKEINAPIVGCFHFRPKNFRSSNASKSKRIGQRLKHYDKLIVLCPEMLVEACEVWPYLVDKFIVLPNSIDTEKISKNSNHSIQLPAGIEPHKYFITVARLTHQKNIQLLLQAFLVAKNLGSDWKLVIVGEGEDKTSLMHLVQQLKIVDRVCFLGYQDNPYPYIKIAGAFVSSSREEGFPVSLIEALTLNCPIISLACPTGPTDILEHGELGKLVPFTESDAKPLGAAMFELSNDPKIAQMYKERMRNKSDKYSSVKIGKEFSNLILGYQRQ
jgi:glycosyltransferase involved in cell wall biosynthesis